jgi:hypothetical protein
MSGAAGAVAATIQQAFIKIQGYNMKILGN